MFEESQQQKDRGSLQGQLRKMNLDEKVKAKFAKNYKLTSF